MSTVTRARSCSIDFACGAGSILCTNPCLTVAKRLPICPWATPNWPLPGHLQVPPSKVLYDCHFDNTPSLRDAGSQRWAQPLPYRVLPLSTSDALGSSCLFFDLQGCFASGISKEMDLGEGGNHCMGMPYTPAPPPPPPLPFEGDEEKRQPKEHLRPRY